MIKRRRAYKRYDWKAHQWAIIKHEVMMAISRKMAKAIDEAFLYGKRSDEPNRVRLAVPSSVQIAVPDYLLKKVLSERKVVIR